MRQGHADAATLLLESGADVNQVTGGDGTSPLLMAVINGHFDLAMFLLDRGANPRLASDNGVTPLYAALNVQWAPKALYPQPRAYTQQKLSYLDFMKRLLDEGRRRERAPEEEGVVLGLQLRSLGRRRDRRDAVLARGVRERRRGHAAARRARRRSEYPDDEAGRPAAHRRRRTRDRRGRLRAAAGSGRRPGVPPLQAATGVGYGEGFAANSHRNAPSGWMPAVKYLVEELGADVNARDHEGNTALHHAAARGDNEMILYLVSKGADVKAVNRAGETTVDMANGPVQRIQPFPETIALLEKLGAKNNHRCKSC